jgi:hypothetical protein
MSVKLKFTICTGRLDVRRYGPQHGRPSGKNGMADVGRLLTTFV